MKIKILLFPLIILVIFYLSVAHIFPDWKSSKEVKDEIDGNQMILDSVVEQQNNITALSSQIASDPALLTQLNDIVPQMRDEESIISAVNQLAQRHQIALLQMTFNDQKKRPTRTKDNLAIQQQFSMTPRSIQVGVVVNGPYNNTKVFVSELSKIMRAHVSQSFSMSRIDQKQEDGEGDGLQDQLDTTISFDYHYLAPITVSNLDSFVHPVLSQDQYDTAPVNEWSTMMTSDITALELGEHGRGNPFLP